MAEYIDKDKIKYLSLPIAPVIVGEEVHYEQGALKEWIDEIPKADVIERECIDKKIENIKNEIYASSSSLLSKWEIIYIIDKHMKGTKND